MTLDLDKEMAGLARLTNSQLQSAYAELFGEPPRSCHRDWLLRRVLWRQQALREGDLSERARRRAAELANDADLRQLPPRRQGVTRAQARKLAARIDSRLPPIGALITRQYKDRTIEVQVLEQGFQHEGAVYKSLSAVARTITGQHCNGFFFFRLGKEATP